MGFQSQSQTVNINKKKIIGHQVITNQRRMKYLYGTAVMAAVLASAQAEEMPLVSTAMEFLSRASSTSEVLTLNLTNLLILLVLKALIFGFGLFSIGGASTARSAEDTSVTETDLTGGMCFLMYTSGAIEKLSCIQRAACEDVRAAEKYYMAGKMWYKMHSMLSLPFPESYEGILRGVEVAKEHGKMGGDCSVYPW